MNLSDLPDDPMYDGIKRLSASLKVFNEAVVDAVLTAAFNCNIDPDFAIECAATLLLDMCKKEAAASYASYQMLQRKAQLKIARAN